MEDHGYILDTGINDLPAFLSYKDIEGKSSEEHESLQVGALVDVVVQKVSDNGRTCNVKLDKNSFALAFVRICILDCYKFAKSCYRLLKYRL